MLFTIVTLLSVAGTFLGLAFHRFWTTREEARSTILYAEIVKRFLAWFALRTIQMSRKASPAGLVGIRQEPAPLAHGPSSRNGLYLGFYGELPLPRGERLLLRGLHPPRPVRLPARRPRHGRRPVRGLARPSWSSSRAGISSPCPKPVSLSLALLDPRKMGITAARVKLWAFWLFVVAGFLLTASALLPMLPLLRTPGQRFMFEFHRYSALVSALAGLVFAGLEALRGRTAALGLSIATGDPAAYFVRGEGWRSPLS